MRKSTPTDQERLSLRALGLDPDDYRALPVMAQLDLQQGLQVLRVQNPEGEVEEVLVVRLMVAMPSKNFAKKVSRLQLPNGAAPSGPLDGIVPQAMSFLLVPEAGLSHNGRSLLDEWDRQFETPSWQAGFDSVSEDHPQGELPPVGEEEEQWESGVAEAVLLAEEHGWPYLALLRLQRALAQFGQVQVDPIPANDARTPSGRCGRCDSTGPFINRKYCDGTPTHPHKRTRVRR